MTRCATLPEAVATSPDGHVAAGFAIADTAMPAGEMRQQAPLWSVSYRGRPVLLPSPLAVAIAGEPPLTSGFTTVRQRRTGLSTLDITLREQDGLKRTITWHIHCANDHAACSFSLPQQANLPRRLVVAGDCSLWRLPPGAAAMTDTASGAAVINLDHGNIALACGWGRFEQHGTALVLTGGGSHITALPFRSRRRCLRLAQRPCDLASLGFHQPADSGGAIVRDDTFSTSGGFDAIRLAGALGARYLLYDYGWCGDPADSAASGLEPCPAPHLRQRYAGWGGLDISAIARAGKSRGIGVLLALPWETLCRSQQELLATYRHWGVAGIKVGRFGAAPGPAAAARLQATARAARNHGLMLIVDDAAWYALPHDAAAPICITSHGDTCSLWQLGALAGAAIADVALTRAHRAARPFVSADGFPILFSGHPLAAAGAHAPEHALWQMLPRDMAWDETRWLRGEAEQYAVVVRRHGARWFLACLNGGAARVHTIRLEEALPPCRLWHVTLYRDPCAADAQPHCGLVVESLEKVHSTDRIRLEMAPGGGYLLVIVADNTSRTHA